MDRHVLFWGRSYGSGPKRQLLRRGAQPYPTLPPVYDRTAWLIHALLSLAGLIVLSPVILLIALAIKATSPGPVFYRGERVGQGRRIFLIYKFRTLLEGAEEKIGARLLNDQDRARYMTRFGKFLKRSKLDELPQLFNVIRGEMRLTGPRPIRPVFLKSFERDIPNYATRYLVPPGITGIAQLRGGYYTHPAHKIRYDLIYIKNRSLLLDLKLVLLTFVKILNRWLGMGCFVLFLFLFVSFVPKSVQRYFYVSLFGARIGLVYLLIVTAAVWVYLRKGPSQFSLYRCPLNRPMLLFVLLSAISIAFSEDPYRALRGTGYYLVTGFLVAFLIVNGLATQLFALWTVRIIALSSVLISVIGLSQIFMLNFTLAFASPAPSYARVLEDYTRMTSVLGNPSVLAAYLVLGIPLLFFQLVQSRSQGERDFWLICTTLSFLGVLFTQTRIGLLALLVAAAVFSYRRPSYGLSFLTALLLPVVLLAFLAVPRFSAPRSYGDVRRWVQETVPELSALPAKTWLIGAGAKTPPVVPPDSADEDRGEGKAAEKVEVGNMHLTLMLEFGIAGWIIVMWLVLSALGAMKRAYDKAKSEDLKVLLWAIISSVAGFLVTMNGVNALHNLPIQIFFWSLIGIGLGIVIHLNGQRRSDFIWRFGDAGD